MILGYLLIMVVSAILFALLIPPLEIENARAGEFEDDAFPKATENSPIPYLIGLARIDSPNTLFVGGFRPEPITERIKVSLFKKKTIIVGYRYYLTIDLGICLGGVEGVTLHAIYVDDKEVWTGTATDDTPFSFADLELFGGHKKGGGFSATCRFYPGTFDQAKNAYIDAMPESGGLLTKYLGISHIVLQDAYVGESPSLKKIGFKVSRFTNTLELVDGKEIIELTTVNIAEAIYAGMVDDWGGMGINPNLIDRDNFVEQADLFFEEKNGGAGVIYREKDGKGFVQELLRQVDAIMGVDPSTNKIIIKPLRLDYDPAELPIYGPSEIISVDSFSQTLWSELVSQVKVGFKNEENDYQDSTAVDQDLAVASITGKLKTVSVSMPFVKKASLATVIAGRELNQLSKPAITSTLMFNRKGYRLAPGSVFKWRWPDYRINDMIMRVKNITAGSDDKAEIKIEVTRDPYGELFTTFADPQPGISTPLTSPPLPVELFDYYDAPEYLVLNADAGFEPDGTGNPSYLMLWPIPANASSIAVSAYLDDDTAYPDQVFPSYGLLETAIDLVDGFSTGILTSIDIETASFPEDYFDGTAADVRTGRNLLWINGEVLGFQDYTALGSNVYRLNTVHRALLNTKQQTHAIGSRVHFLDTDDFFSLSVADQSTSPAVVKFVPSSGAVTLDPAGVTGYNVPLVGAYDRPDPPDYIRVDGARTLVDAEPGGTTYVVTWRARDKSLGTVQLIADAADTVSDMTWSLYIFNITRNTGPIYTATGLTLQTRDVILPADDNYGDTLEIRVYSVKGGRTSITYDWFRFTVRPAANLLLEGDEQTGTDILLLDGEVGAVALEGDEG